MSDPEPMGHAAGLLALVGGAEWQAGADFDAELLERSGADEVLVLPTAAAYENPDRAVKTASEWFSSLGTTVRALMVLRHVQANDAANAAVVAEARFIYLSGGSPLHLLSVLKGSLVFEALARAWRHGAVVAGSSAGAMVLVDPMVDPRGGAFTVGLGLVEQLAVVPHHDSGASHHFWRTLELAPAGLPIAGIPERTALIRDRDGSWRSAGDKDVSVYLNGVEVGLEALPR
ncbi:MAG: Type 1 glutamine amidotransferase-like domain-containing protein [Acidimicrobiales bacterium]|jgi:cyanophycinase